MNKKVKRMIIINVLKILIPLLLICVIMNQVASLEYNEKMQEKEKAKYKDITQIEYKSEELVKINIVKINDVLLQGMYSNFYSVSDGNKDYLIEVNSEINISDILQKKQSYEFKGIMIKMSDQIRDYIIDNLKDENKITNEEFIEKYSEFFISSYRNIYSLEGMILTINMILSIFLLLYIFLFIYTLNRTLKTIIRLNKDDLKKIKQELKEDDVKVFRKNNVVLTKSYVLNLNFGFIGVKYDDIIWIYPYYEKMFSLDRIITIYTKQKNRVNKYDIALTKKIGKKAKESITEIYNEITKNTSTALKGYTLENREKINKM